MKLGDKCIPFAILVYVGFLGFGLEASCAGGPDVFGML